MSKYQENFINHLNDLIHQIEIGNFQGENGAIKKFETYVFDIQEIGSFSIDNWKQNWREKVWKFGEQFKKLNPSGFLNVIDNIIDSESITNREVLEFIRSEIIVNFLPDVECKKQIQILIEKYPLNPEFRNTLGHYYCRENQLLEAIQEYKLAVKIDPKNNKYLQSRFHNEQNYIDKLIIEGEYQIGLNFLKKLLSEKEYLDSGTNLHKAFIDYQRRLNDHLHFQNKLQSLEEVFKQRMNNELESERKRIIEILGFFSAIMAFILSTVSIGENFTFIEAIYFIIGLGIILILFTISMSCLFSNKKAKLNKDKRFVAMICTLILLLIYLVVAGIISDIIK